MERGVRDYIHVVNLAIEHVKTLEKIINTIGVETYNLGTGRGYSVLEFISAFEKVTAIKISYKIVGRCSGDVAICYADPTKAKEELGWVATRGIEEMCRDAWRWQSNNPNGYESVLLTK
jgi:UDP-glucose 4-epimerase